MDKQVERFRLTSKANSLIDEVRQGRGTYDERRLADYLWRVSKDPAFYLAMLRRQNVSPSLQADFTHLLEDGWAELYTDSILDMLDEAFTPEGTEEEFELDLGSIEVTPIGQSAMRMMSSQYFDFILPDREKEIGAWLFRWLEEPEEVPPWITRSLIDKGYMRRTLLDKYRDKEDFLG